MSHANWIREAFGHRRKAHDLLHAVDKHEATKRNPQDE
jgi:hypothetical protein